jgi:hypothetical protein
VEKVELSYAATLGNSATPQSIKRTQHMIAPRYGSKRSEALSAQTSFSKTTTMLFTIAKKVESMQNIHQPMSKIDSIHKIIIM